MNDDCLTCEGSGICTACRGGSTHEIGQTCQCMATHKCIDCYGEGTYEAYASIQIQRMTRLLFERTGRANE